MNVQIKYAFRSEQDCSCWQLQTSRHKERSTLLLPQPFLCISNSLSGWEMDTVSCILLFLFTFTFVQGLRSLFTSSTKAARHKLPPGPVGIPMFGNLLQLGKKPHQTLATLAEIHGPIMSLKLGQVTTVVMSSAETAKAVLQSHDQFLSNRKIPDAMKGASLWYTNTSSLVP